MGGAETTFDAKIINATLYLVAHKNLKKQIMLSQVIILPCLCSMPCWNLVSFGWIRRSVIPTNRLQRWEQDLQQWRKWSYEQRTSNNQTLPLPTPLETWLTPGTWGTLSVPHHNNNKKWLPHTPLATNPQTGMDNLMVLCLGILVQEVFWGREHNDVLADLTELGWIPVIITSTLLTWLWFPVIHKFTLKLGIDRS